MEPRILLTDGVTNTAAPPLHGSTGVPLTNVLVASFTIDDPSALPSDQWLGRIVWGDGGETKQISNVPGPNNTFEIHGTHTYALAGTYTISEFIGIPFLAIGGHNMVTTSAIITDAAPPPPTVQNISFDFAHGNAIKIQFDQDVSASLDVLDVQLTNVTTGKPVPAAELTLAYDQATNIATVKSTSPLPDGNYHFSLVAAGVSNTSGGTLAADVPLDFFILAGDADRDRNVGFADLVAVGQNYGTSGKTWAQGDFTNDGSVDFADLVVLAQNYGKSVPLPQVAPAPVAVPAPSQAAVASRGISATVVQNSPATAGRSVVDKKQGTPAINSRPSPVSSPRVVSFNSRKRIVPAILK